MVVPHAMKRGQNTNKLPGKKIKLSGKHGGFAPGLRFGPPAMMDRPGSFWPGPFPVVHPGHRFPPLPPPPLMFRGRMGPPPAPSMCYSLMGPPRRPPRVHGPGMRPGPLMMPPRPFPLQFLNRPIFHGPPGLLPSLNFPPSASPRSFRNKTYRKNIKNSKKRPVKAKSSLKNSAPGTTIVESFLNDMTKPWITVGIRSENLKKQQLNKAARETRTDEAWGAFKVQRDKCHCMIREARKQYLITHPEETCTAPFQINPDTDCKRLDFTEDTLL